MRRLRGDAIFEMELAELDNKQKYDADANKTVTLIGLFRDPFLRYCVLLSAIINMGTELVGYVAVNQIN